MTDKEVFTYLKGLGCCDGCCLRYLGLKNPNAYENSKEFVSQYKPDDPGDTTDSESKENGKSHGSVNGDVNGEGEGPPAKRLKASHCSSCLGVLQEDSWPECFESVVGVMNKKSYKCPTFACALSAPIATILREKTITLMLLEKFTDYDAKKITALKEAWKWSFGVKLAEKIDKSLDSGACAPLLITVNIEYPNDIDELEPLKQISPQLFEDRSRQKRRFTIEFTRRSVEQALDGAGLAALQRHNAALPTITAGVQCVSVSCVHEPMFLGGRYIKLSRELPQSPWVLEGRRVMDSSVQEVIFEPIASLFNVNKDDVEHKLKFIAAGREDVDVRCLGDGRPFAIEISDPTKEPTAEELSQLCEEIKKDGRVIVEKLVIIDKDSLNFLKQGEETKWKTYEALCIKLAHTEHDDKSKPIEVTERDLDALNNFTNEIAGEPGRIHIVQKTPIRVLHRRPLLSRKRVIHELKATAVPDQPQLFKLSVSTSAGTYIKEWVHGEVGRSRPAVGVALGAPADLIALDVTRVWLHWPPEE